MFPSQGLTTSVLNPVVVRTDNIVTVQKCLGKKILPHFAANRGQTAVLAQTLGRHGSIPPCPLFPRACLELGLRRGIRVVPLQFEYSCRPTIVDSRPKWMQASLFGAVDVIFNVIM